MSTLTIASSVRILSCLVTASLLLPNGIPDYTGLGNQQHEYVNVADNRPSYEASVLSFPSQVHSNELGSTLPLRGVMKVQIRNTMKKMEWN